MESSTPLFTQFVYCFVCRKYTSVAPQGEKNLRHHYDGSSHTKQIAAKQIAKPGGAFMYEKNFKADNIACFAEIRFARFYAKHDLPLEAADRFIHFISTYLYFFS